MSDFYIGWNGPSSNSRRTSRKFYFTFLILMFLIVGLFTLYEHPFSSSSFAYGNQTQLEGYLLEEPVIAVRIHQGDKFEILPLVGYGKMGPHAALEDLLGKGNYQVKLKGTLIEHQGKRFFELTDGKASVLEFNTSNEMNHQPSSLGVMEVSGEIMDPKCFFGVMKPGFGKVHRSCAIRCISGRIPPVLAIRKGNEFEDFYFITNMEGKMLKDELLSYVGKQLTVSGNVSEIDDWKSISLESLEVSWIGGKITKCI